MPVHVFLKKVNFNAELQVDDVKTDTQTYPLSHVTLLYAQKNLYSITMAKLSYVQKLPYIVSFF